MGGLAGRLGHQPVGVLVQSCDPGDDRNAVLRGVALYNHGPDGHRRPPSGVPAGDQLDEDALNGRLKPGRRCPEPRSGDKCPGGVNATDDQRARERHREQDRRQRGRRTTSHRAFGNRTTAHKESVAARATTLTLATVAGSTGGTSWRP